MKSLGDFIAKRRKDLVLSQKDLADQLNVSIPTISKWESGDRIPDLAILGSLAKILKVDIESLFNGESILNNNFDIENEFNIESFSKHFTFLRKLNNHTLVSLSSSLNIRYQTISKWESGESLPNIYILKQCADLFNVSLAELYYGKNFDNNNDKQDNELIVNESKNNKSKKNKKIINICLLCCVILLLSIVGVILNNKGNNLMNNSNSSSSFITNSSTSTNKNSGNTSLSSPSSSKESTSSSSNLLDNKVIVTYKFDKFIDDIAILIDKGSTANQYNPNIEGYHVEYYYKDELFDFDTEIKDHITLQGVFIINTYLVTFYDAKYNIIETQNIDYNQSAVAPAVTNEDENLKFLKWSEDFSHVKSDLSIYPIFINNVADITFNTAGGTCDIDYIYEYSSSMFDSLPVPSKKGYEFIGWYNDNKLFTKYDEIYSPTLLTAKYDAVEFTITFDSNGGNCATTSLKVYFDSEITLPSTYKENESFIGWFYNDELIPSNFIYNFDHNIEVIAKYSNLTTLYVYIDNGDSIELINYTGKEENIVLPSSINGKPVTSISTKIFDDNANNIKSIRIPSSISTFKQGLLKNLTNLEKLYICPSINTSLINLFDHSIPESFDTIEFYGENKFFYSDQLFINCNKLFSIIINEDFNDLLLDNGSNYTKELYINANNYIGSTILVIGWNKLQKIQINDRLKKIRDYMFNECINLREVILCDNIEEIGKYAFYSCISLESFIIPNQVKIINASTFQYCYSIKSIVIPANTSIIYDNAFFGCFALENVYFQGTLEQWKKINMTDKYSNPLYYGGKLYINGKLVTDQSAYPTETYQKNN